MSDGWCGGCSDENPTPTKPESRLEKWLTDNANEIEDLMRLLNLDAVEAITIIAVENKIVATCAICGSHVKRTRHQNFFCSNTEQCLKARRYYKYLVYEKNTDKEDAFNRTLEKFK